MDAKVNNLTRALKRYDRDLYAERASDCELIGVYRKVVRWETYHLDGSNLVFSRPSSEPVMFLTHNWKINGQPVDWGTEPLMARIRAFDGWNHDSVVEEVIAERESLAKNRQRAFRNELKARAADMRQEFAKAVNDINTSSLEMVDKRRIKDGFSK